MVNIAEEYNQMGDRCIRQAQKVFERVYLMQQRLHRVSAREHIAKEAVYSGT